MRISLVLLFFCLVCSALLADTLISANITSSSTWDLAGSPYIINGTRLIGGAANPVVTVEPGVVIKFNAGAILQIGPGSGSQGSLVINGTAENPVLITANSLSPTPGFWGCIRSNANTDQALFNYAIFEYGGSGSALFETGGGNPVLDHCIFRYSETNGIFSTVTTAGPSVTNCSFDNNASYPIQTNSTFAGLIGSGNQFSNNGIQRILLNAVNLSSGATWLNHGIPYELDDNQYLSQ